MCLKVGIMFLCSTFGMEYYSAKFFFIAMFMLSLSMTSDSSRIILFLMWGVGCKFSQYSCYTLISRLLYESMPQGRFFFFPPVFLNSLQQETAVTYFLALVSLELEGAGSFFCCSDAVSVLGGHLLSNSGSNPMVE